jgi:hypothetical protein
MTPSVTLEALDMLYPLFFFYLLELLFVWATIGKMSHFMAPIAHEMRKLSLFLLSFALCHLFFEAKATLVTIDSLSLQYMLKGDF